jgi:uncharacterized SAM-binding protein YcdF (DUF218 family)
MRIKRRILTALEVIVAVVLILLVDLGVSGYLVFTHARVDPLQKADAIIVLGGEHDGREDYGIRLAREGWAKTVVISDPYWSGDRTMKRVCPSPGERAGPDAGEIEVICRRPEPMTTRGEALIMRELAEQRGWRRIIVVSWQYHLPRARLIFRQCYTPDAAATVMVAVPRRYQYSLLEWEFVYAYQWGGLAKAVVQGECT